MHTSYKIIIALGILGFLFIGLFSFLTSNSYEKNLTDQMEKHAIQLSEVIKISTKNDMLLKRRKSMFKMMHSIAGREEIDTVRIINKAGLIIFSSKTDEQMTMINKKTAGCIKCHAMDKPLEKLPSPQKTRIFTRPDGVRLLGVMDPIYNEKSCWQGACHYHTRDRKVLGVLDISMALTNVDTHIETYRREMLVFTFFALVANSLILVFVIQRLIGKPIREFLKSTESVSRGNFNYKVEIDKRHEFYELGQSFNLMTDKLHEVQMQLYQNAKLASVGKLAAGVAHELNNPLTGVLTYSSLELKRIETGNINEENLNKTLNVIIRETVRCRDIIKGLLDFSRQIPPRMSEININEVIEQSLSIVINELILSNISVQKQLDPELPLMKGDRIQIQQVLINLLMNGQQAIGTEGGAITITTATCSKNFREYIRVEIRDTGCGIPKHKIPEIFEPFYSTKGQKGTGLGLSIVWGIVDKHEGFIEVDSEIDRGTSFSVYFPLENESTNVNQDEVEKSR